MNNICPICNTICISFWTKTFLKYLIVYKYFLTIKYVFLTITDTLLCSMFLQRCVLYCQGKDTDIAVTS